MEQCLDNGTVLPKSAPQERPAMHQFRTDETASPVAEEAAAWFVRRRSGGFSAQDHDGFARWLAADPAHAREYAAVEALWRELDGLQPPALQHHRPRALPWAAAAMVLLALGASLYAVLAPEIERTARGEMRQVTLADGTQARLNSDTVLVVRFSSRERRIELRRGEALFEVAPDAARPFSVEVDDATIRDIGTRFDVNRSKDRLHVMVTDGRVEVDAAGLARCGLDAGFAAVVTPGGACNITPLDPDRLAWLEGRLIFSDTPLHQVVEEYNRYQSPPLRLGDESVGTLRLSGTFRTDHLGGLPALLPRTLPVTVEATEDGPWLLRSIAPRP
jgi:transmembrane sensor